MPHPLIDRNGSCTAAELSARVAQLRGALLARDLRPGDRVVLVVANERESVALYHAVTDLAGVAVLTQVSAGLSELRAAIDITSPTLVVLAPPAHRLADEAAALTEVPVVSSSDLQGPEASAVPIDPASPRVVTFTSGTTSQPKGVVHTAHSLAAATTCFIEMTGTTADDRLFLVSPLGSITGVTQVLELAPAVGATTVLEDAFHDEHSLDLLLESGGTFYGGPDVVVDRLLAVAATRGVSVPLRVAALGGTMLRRDLLDRAEAAGITVIRVYGSSEVPWSTGGRLDDPADQRLHDEGRAGPGVELRLSDDGTSELLIRGPHQFWGYLGSDDDPLVDGWFRTGDEAVLEAGRVKIVGRLKDVASRNGKKISLPEVDHYFREASGVGEVAAFIVPDDATGERVAVAVAVPPEVTLDVPQVLAAMQAAGLARFKLPESVVRWNGDLPLTTTGKVQRRLLVEGDQALWRAERLRTTA